MTDRRRINGPIGVTSSPVFVPSLTSSNLQVSRPARSRAPAELRKLFLKTGLTPSASGSAYLELEQSTALSVESASFNSITSTLKLTCTVHGPRPLPRSAPFTPNVSLSTTIKFAPFAARERRGYIRDASERDLAVHLETALRGVVIGERWPKSGVEIVVTVLEGEDDAWWSTEAKVREEVMEMSSASGMLSVLAGCITVASAAMVDAGLDCIDIVTGGVAAIVRQPSLPGGNDSQLNIILDPNFSEHKVVLAACVIGYIQSRDEITELWMKGSIPALPHSLTGGQSAVTLLIDGAVQAAAATRTVLAEAVRESIELKTQSEKLLG
ncbi:3'-5'-exoribonuclease [Lambiella insularis]|nr:3'-5'-exoribonuclease [Lambiella insularis]